VRGRPHSDAPLDWCDRLHSLVRRSEHDAPPAGCAVVASTSCASVVVVRLGELVEALVVEHEVAAADPARATRLLEQAAEGSPLPLDRHALTLALRAVAPLVRERLAGIAMARWRGADRDRAGRRLVPLVLAAARRAARSGRARRLARLDALVGRLVAGLTAGEALLLEDLLARRAALDVEDLLEWHERLPPCPSAAGAPTLELVAAVVLNPGTVPRGSSD
jgi:hypothetical protein